MGSGITNKEQLSSPMSYMQEQLEGEVGGKHEGWAGSATVGCRHTTRPLLTSTFLHLSRY